MGHYDEVEVRSRFDGRWVAGFELADVRQDGGEGAGFMVRRQSDGRVLPEPFGPEEVRPAHSQPLS